MFAFLPVLNFYATAVNKKRSIHTYIILCVLVDVGMTGSVMLMSTVRILEVDILDVCGECRQLVFHYCHIVCKCW